MFSKLLRNLSLKLKVKLNPEAVVFFGLLLLFIILRFYQLEERLPFGWDQVQNSWIMKGIFVNHQLPLEGMVAKGNSGFYIGPAYYYLLAPFYFIFRLDPIASGIFAGMVAIVNFIVLYLVTKKLFSVKIAELALFFYTFSAISLTTDRIAWPVIFIPFVSVLIFHFLYQALTGKPENLLWLALVMGFAFHVHFTAIFFPIIIVLTIPLLLRNKKNWIYGLTAVPIFLVWFIPNILAGTHNSFSAITNLTHYVSTYYQGFHLVRFKQLTSVAFIQFASVLYFNWAKIFSVTLLPVFLFILYKDKHIREVKKLDYIFILWFLIPWVVFTVYSGEISDYYFVLNRPLVFMILAYLVYRLIQNKLIIVKFITVTILMYYAVVNFKSFDNNKYAILPKVRELVKEDIREGRIVKFYEGNPEDYLYYVETHIR